MRFRSRPPGVVSLLIAAHPVVALAMSLAVGAAAALFGGRSVAEVGLVAGTVLLGQFTIGWMDDIADRRRDKEAGRQNRPLAMGWLAPSTAAWATAYATCGLVPLAVSNGREAGAAYLLSVLVAWVGTRVLQRSVLSWVPFALSFALLPAFLSYGGWGGGSQGDPPTVAVTVAAGMVGIAVHFLFCLPHLVGDNLTGQRHLPLRIAKRIGAPRLLWGSVGYLALAVGGLVYAGVTAGLRQ